MTEGDWLACADLQKMLEWLRSGEKFNDRKAHLFAIACCRRVWPLLTDERSCRAVELAERYADDEAGHEEILAAWAPTWEAANDAHDAAAAAEASSPVAPWDAESAATAAGHTLAGQPYAAADAALAAALNHKARKGESPTGKEREHQASLLRDLFGPLPFRPVAFDSAWRTSAVLALATTIYAERRFEDLPILADALEEAGCGNPEILGHLREQGQEHARGCWCLDLVLGRS